MVQIPKGGSGGETVVMEENHDTARRPVESSLNDSLTKEENREDEEGTGRLRSHRNNSTEGHEIALKTGTVKMGEKVISSGEIKSESVSLVCEGCLNTNMTGSDEIREFSAPLSATRSNVPSSPFIAPSTSNSSGPFKTINGSPSFKEAQSVPSFILDSDSLEPLE